MQLVEVAPTASIKTIKIFLEFSRI